MAKVNDKKNRNSCVAYGCTSIPINNPDIHFHRFPKHETTKEKWVSCIKRKNWQPTQNSVVCSRHFELSCYQVPPGVGRRVRLLPYAVPTIFPEMPDYMQPPAKKLRKAPATRASLRVPYEKEASPSPTAVFQSIESCQPSTSASDILNLTDANSSPAKVPSIQSDSCSKPTAGRPAVPPYARIKQYQRRINALSQQVNRLKKKNKIQMKLIKMLQTEVTLGASQLDSIDAGVAELLRNEARNVNKSKGRRYSQKIRCFAFTIYYYSPKTYKYLRTMFKLPSPRLIRRWMSSVDLSPGFIVEQFDRICKTKPYSLVMDGMSLRKRQILDSSGVIHGNTDFGGNLSTDSTSLATEALVFLLVPITGGERVPCAYFFINKTDAEAQCSLINQCLTIADEKKIDVVSLTCDGCPANISTLNKLGAHVPDRPWFEHPSNGQRVNVMLDPPHMLKLARNTFASLRQLKTPDGIADYSYIEMLHEHQTEMGLHLANKLRKKHMNWKNIKMKVSLAAQMLSSSVADSLEYMSTFDQRFAQAGPTITFIRVIDRLFDMLNSSSPVSRGYKSALYRNNIEVKQSNLVDCVAYLNQLKLTNGKLVNMSRNKTFIIGFQMAASSVIETATMVFSKYPETQFIMTYKLCQDHIETLFSKIRSKSGFNNNPDVLQFQSALKGLLMKADISSSPSANCLELESDRVILYSRKPEKKDEDCVYSDFLEDVESTESYQLATEVCDIVEYIAGFVIRTMKITCSDCVSFLSDGECRPISHSSLIKVKDRGGLIIPPNIVFRLCTLTEAVVRRASLKHEPMSKTLFKKLRVAALQAVLDRRLHLSVTCSAHAMELCKQLIERYLKIRIHYVLSSSLDTDSTQRGRLHRLVVVQNI